MLTAEAKAKRIATAQTRLDRLNDERAALTAKVEKVDREIRLTTLDLDYRKAAPTIDDADLRLWTQGTDGTPTTGVEYHPAKS